MKLPSYSSIAPLIKANWRSGLTVAFISVPLSIALSIASGAGPLPGIITGIWATAVASIFGSSNYNVIGAAGALTSVLFAATLAAPYELGAAMLPVLALGTGLIIFLIWLLKLDRFLYHIPSSVMYGFAAGVAFLIAASQLFDATGLSALKRTGHFSGDIELFLANITMVHVPSLLVFALFLLFILGWKRYVPRLPAVIPAAILGMFFGFVESNMLHLDLISLGEKFGAISGAIVSTAHVAALQSLVEHPELFLWVIKASVIIALIAVLETLITAKIGDKITRTQSSSSRELLGLSLANFAAGSMGGLPATGVFIRTGANIKAGATHRTSAFIAAALTAVIAISVLPLFAYLPVVVIAAILINTAIGLIETEKFWEFWAHEKESFTIAFIVTVITVFEDAGIAVLIGAGLALLIFANKQSRGRIDLTLNYPDMSHETHRGAHSLVLPDKPVSILTYSIAGNVGYIDSERHASNFRAIAGNHNVRSVIIRLRNLFSMDYEAQIMLRDAILELHKSGKIVAISSANPEMASELRTSPEISANVLFGTYTEKTHEVLERMRSRLAAA